jgi:hypothetical protein
MRPTSGMKTVLIAGVLAVVLSAAADLRAAHAMSCQLITATHSARSWAMAAQTSQALAVQTARNLQRARGWSTLTLSAYAVPGDPFWKAVRPHGVPAKAQLSPDIVTPQFHTTCFTGVVVPYVCTTGSSACGQ